MARVRKLSIAVNTSTKLVTFEHLQPWTPALIACGPRAHGLRFVDRMLIGYSYVTLPPQALFFSAKCRRYARSVLYFTGKLRKCGAYYVEQENVDNFVTSQ